VTVTRGVVYMAWGENAIAQAEHSMRSLWRFAPEMPVLVVGDADAHGRFNIYRNVTVRTIPVDPFDMDQKAGHKFLAGRVKPLLYDLAFDETLYGDADTEFVASPVRGFELLQQWELVLAEQSKRSSLGKSPFLRCEREDTVLLLGTGELVYHNSGMLFWKRCPAVAELMRMWTHEWQRYQGWDEQIALLRALFYAHVLFLTVPYTWNCKDAQKATLLHHAYGDHGARIEKRGARERGETVWQKPCRKRPPTALAVKTALRQVQQESWSGR